MYKTISVAFNLRRTMNGGEWVPGVQYYNKRAQMRFLSSLPSRISVQQQRKDLVRQPILTQSSLVLVNEGTGHVYATLQAVKTRSRNNFNTNPNDIEANAAGRSVLAKILQRKCLGSWKYNTPSSTWEVDGTLENLEQDSGRFSVILEFNTSWCHPPSFSNYTHIFKKQLLFSA